MPLALAVVLALQHSPGATNPSPRSSLALAPAPCRLPACTPHGYTGILPGLELLPRGTVRVVVKCRPPSLAILPTLSSHPRLVFLGPLGRQYDFNTVTGPSEVALALIKSEITLTLSCTLTSGAPMRPRYPPPHHKVVPLIRVRVRVRVRVRIRVIRHHITGSYPWPGSGQGEFWRSR